MSGTEPEWTDQETLLVFERVVECCDRFEAAWRRSERPRIEAYLTEVTEPVRPVLLRELLVLELELRRDAGEQPAPQEYRSRFPDHEAAVAVAWDATPPPAECDREAATGPGDRFAARAMREVLVDHARRRRASKRPGKRARVPLDRALAALDEQGLDVLALHEALERLARGHPRPAQVVELRFFGGLSVPKVAEALGVSDTTVESDWRFARAWLRGQLGGTPG
jgi:RNA polymerase sigma factor (sigma-70 family)